MKFIIIALVLILFAILLFWLSHRQTRHLGLPGGEIVTSDTGLWQTPTQVYFDPRLYLSGKPDYVIRDKEGFIPVEVKTGRTPLEPYDSHIIQLAAYCHLIDQATGLRPPYGLLNYPGKTFKVDFTEELEQTLLALITDLRQKEGVHHEPARSHDDFARCRKCGYRSHCSERLV